jgi:hypothetical protein
VATEHHNPIRIQQDDLAPITGARTHVYTRPEGQYFQAAERRHQPQSKAGKAARDQAIQQAGGDQKPLGLHPGAGPVRQQFETPRAALFPLHAQRHRHLLLNLAIRSPDRLRGAALRQKAARILPSRAVS